MGRDSAATLRWSVARTTRSQSGSEGTTERKVTPTAASTRSRVPPATAPVPVGTGFAQVRNTVPSRGAFGREGRRSGPAVHCSTCRRSSVVVSWGLAVPGPLDTNDLVGSGRATQELSSANAPGPWRDFSFRCTTGRLLADVRNPENFQPSRRGQGNDGRWADSRIAHLIEVDRVPPSEANSCGPKRNGPANLVKGADRRALGPSEADQLVLPQSEHAVAGSGSRTGSCIVRPENTFWI
jgi:hypothetical protein